MTTTIQQTSKGLKLQEIIAVLLILVGLIAGISNPETPLTILFVIGLVWWVVVKALIWWRHK